MIKIKLVKQNFHARSVMGKQDQCNRSGVRLHHLKKMLFITESYKKI